MALSFRCPECQADLVLSAASPGTYVKCTSCEKSILVPVDATEVNLRKQSGGAGGSGAGSASSADEDMPQEIRRCRFNWGAFFLTPIWLLFHGRIAIGLLLIGLSIVLNLAGQVSPLMGLLTIPIFLVIAIYFGTQGYKIAWSGSGIYDTVEDVKRRERNWAIVGLIIFVVLFVLRIALGSL